MKGNCYNSVRKGAACACIMFSLMTATGRGEPDDLGSSASGSVYVPQAACAADYDEDGNQTRVTTPTGVWQVEYNAENRPVRWTCGRREILMSYDYRGRRVRCLEVEGGVTNRADGFIYDGYLQICNFDSTTTTSNCNYFVWDPTETTATRPLEWDDGSEVRRYAFDGNKNVSEVLGADGTIDAHYEYAPFGEVLLSSGEAAQDNPWRFSSEYADGSLGLVYYNYRHYDPVAGRWLSRDPIEETGGLGLYLYCQNFTVAIDKFGLIDYKLNEHRCTLEVLLSWEVVFKGRQTFDHGRSTTQTLEWNSNEKKLWLSNVEKVIEGYFNELSEGLNTTGSKKYKCPGCARRCKDGVSVKLDLQFKSPSLLERYAINSHYHVDFVIEVFKVPNDGESWVSNNPNRLTNLSIEETLNGEGQQSLRSDEDAISQISAIHEVGHQLGLSHPGQKSKGRKPTLNSAADYDADRESIMGRGMIMREDDFYSAFCSKMKWSHQ